MKIRWFWKQSLKNNALLLFLARPIDNTCIIAFYKPGNFDLNLWICMYSSYGLPSLSKPASPLSNSDPGVNLQRIPWHDIIIYGRDSKNYISSLTNTVVCCSLYYEHQGPRLKNINRSRERGLMSSILQMPNEKVHLSSTSYILIFPPIFYTSAEKTWIPFMLQKNREESLFPLSPYS